MLQSIRKGKEHCLVYYRDQQLLHQKGHVIHFRLQGIRKTQETSGKLFQIPHHSMNHINQSIRMLINTVRWRSSICNPTKFLHGFFFFFFFKVEKSWKLGNSPSHSWILIAASAEFWLNNKPDKVWHKLSHCRKPSNAEVQSSAAAFPVDFLGKGRRGRKGKENESYY